MAFYDNILSFHWIDKEIPITCKLLLVRQIKNAQPHLIAPHSHNFWQLEIPLTHDFMFYGKDREDTYKIRKGNFVLIPPNITHGFNYTKISSSWLTIRFSAECCDIPRDIIHIGDKQEKSASLVISITQLLTSYTTISCELLNAIENLLAALLREVFQAKRDWPLSLSEQIAVLVSEAAGNPITISQIADRIGLSINHVTTSFREATGRTLKSFIDEKRLEHATRLLSFTNFSISEIAQQMGFNDIFSFSRFFRRMEGMSPTKYRKRDN